MKMTELAGYKFLLQDNSAAFLEGRRENALILFKISEPLWLAR
jgi:hypothetical protein